MNITMEDIPINPNWTRLDILAVVCERVLEEEEEIVKETAMHEAESREKLMRVENPNRPIDDQVKTRIKTRKREYDPEDKRRRIIGKKRKKSETGKILPMPQIVKDRINQLEKGVKEVKFIIEKEIFKTDCGEHQNRLSIPITQVVEKFLTDEEEKYLCMPSNGNRINFKKVRVIDPSLDIYELELRRWKMTESAIYALNGKWTKMRVRNKIKKGNTIQIWAVRMDDDELIIVIMKLSPDEKTKVIN
uniref:TF-B3 domain-containing protein n=2 Tax=Solanum lycopersicum TaxID=4081 RepID=A0A3Q7FUL2_SOLLC|nr:putative B3 domain-containing protein At2g27410 [Solanum lycopersicum]